MVTDLNRKIDELQGKADEAVKLKDQLDESVSVLTSRVCRILIFSF